jgi:hypothetical protein
MSQHVRVHPGYPNSCGTGQVFEPAGGSVPVHPGTDHVAQDGPVEAAVDGAVDGSGYRWWEWDKHHLAAFAAHP